MIMKWLTVEHSPIPVDFGGEYLIRQPPSSCCDYLERSIYRHSTLSESIHLLYEHSTIYIEEHTNTRYLKDHQVRLHVNSRASIPGG